VISLQTQVGITSKRNKWANNVTDSKLNFDLRCHFLRDNATCDMCGYHTENAFYFFFECAHFSEPRYNIFDSINAMQLQVPIFLKLLLCGNETLNFKDTEMFFKFVHNYISQSKRF
jgi:hypothetical protein